MFSEVEVVRQKDKNCTEREGEGERAREREGAREGGREGGREERRLVFKRVPA
jgi:hypothetical protein